MSSMESNVTGEGTYGCVHHPPLYCKNSRTKDIKMISKLMETYEANKELTEYVLIDKIDRAKQFYLGIPKNVHSGMKNQINMRSQIEKRLKIAK